MGHEVTGDLAAWDDVEAEADWSSLLLGNGFSRHLWSGFRYSSLFDRAVAAGHLDVTDHTLFEVFRTENFERVLAALSTSIAVADVLGDPTDHLFDRYTSIQQALGKAVREVHPALDEIRRATREDVRRILRGYRRIFTTSYDLLLYWCSGAGKDGQEYFDGFKDFFWSSGRLEFDPSNTAISEDRSTRVYYVHGALHLAVNGAGITRKRTRTVWNLLEQFALPDTSDPTSRPLLISEGDAHDKLVAIHENDYLSFVFSRLRSNKRPLVVFGHSLGEQDNHLIRALNRRPERPIAVGMRDHGQVANRARRAEIRKALEADDLFFYDAGSHPLGWTTHCIDQAAA